MRARASKRARILSRSGIRATALRACHRVAYDFALPIAKACKAGLLPFYATVPAPLQTTLKWTAHTLGLHGLAKRVAAVRQRKRREATATRLDKH